MRGGGGYHFIEKENGDKMETKIAPLDNRKKTTLIRLFVMKLVMKQLCNLIVSIIMTAESISWPCMLTSYEIT